MATVKQLRVSEEATSFMAYEAQQKLPDETGGILVGKVSDTEVYIWRAIGPGPNAMHGRSSFLRDGKHSQLELDEAYAASGGALDYIGEWHSHPRQCGPSTTDIASIRSISEAPAYQAPYPILLLCVRSKTGWHLVGYEWNGRGIVLLI